MHNVKVLYEVRVSYSYSYFLFLSIVNRQPGADATRTVPTVKRWKASRRCLKSRFCWHFDATSPLCTAHFQFNVCFGRRNWHAKGKVLWQYWASPVRKQTVTRAVPWQVAFDWNISSSTSIQKHISPRALVLVHGRLKPINEDCWLFFVPKLTSIKNFFCRHWPTWRL